jgi:DNA-binding NarL/FixJ family response regulator
MPINDGKGWGRGNILDRKRCGVFRWRSPLNAPRVLLADDNRAVAQWVSEFLSPAFDIVGIAHDGQDLIYQARRLRPEVVVTDISMPVLTGIEAVRELRVTSPATRFVFLTVHDGIEFVQACLNEGALGYVLKSAMKTDLGLAIHAAIQGQLFISAAIRVPTPESLASLIDPR